MTSIISYRRNERWSNAHHALWWTSLHGISGGIYHLDQSVSVFVLGMSSHQFEALSISVSRTKHNSTYARDTYLCTSSTRMRTVNTAASLAWLIVVDGFLSNPYASLSSPSLISTQLFILVHRGTCKTYYIDD